MAYFANGTECEIFQERWCARCIHSGAEECRYCREDAVGVDRLGNRACEAHIEEADDYA